MINILTMNNIFLYTAIFATFFYVIKIILYFFGGDADTDIDFDSIKLKDGYLNFRNTYNSMMLVNGLKDCAMEEVAIAEINKKLPQIKEINDVLLRARVTFNNCLSASSIRAFISD